MALKCFATRSVTKEEVARALRIVAKNESLCGSIKDIELTFCALVKDGEFHKHHSYNQTVLKLLEKLEAAAMTANADMTHLAVEEKDSVLHLTKGKLNNKNFQLHLNHNHTIHNYYAGQAFLCSQIALTNRTNHEKVVANLIPKRCASVDQIGVHCANRRPSSRQRT